MGMRWASKSEVLPPLRDVYSIWKLPPHPDAVTPVGPEEEAKAAEEAYEQEWKELIHRLEPGFLVIAPRSYKLGMFKGEYNQRECDETRKMSFPSPIVYFYEKGSFSNKEVWQYGTDSCPSTSPGAQQDTWLYAEKADVVNMIKRMEKRVKERKDEGLELSPEEVEEEKKLVGLLNKRLKGAWEEVDKDMTELAEHRAAHHRAAHQRSEELTPLDDPERERLAALRFQDGKELNVVDFRKHDGTLVYVGARHPPRRWWLSK